jgi:hypothetical protein
LLIHQLRLHFLLFWLFALIVSTTSYCGCEWLCFSKHEGQTLNRRSLSPHQKYLSPPPPLKFLISLPHPEANCGQSWRRRKKSTKTWWRGKILVGSGCPVPSLVFS